MSWVLNDPEFLEKYNAAREIQTDRMVDEILDIADDGSNDWMEREIKGQTITVLDHEHVQRSKLRVEARLRVAAKLLPKKYGDRVGDVNVNTTIQTFQISPDKLQSIRDRHKASLEAYGR